MGKFLNKLRETLSYVPKKALVAFGIATAVAVPLVVGAYGPERGTYTIDNPADHITFNSITNNPNIGDERNFVGARDASTGDNGINNVWNANEITVEDGKEYYVRMYVHNNAAANLGLVAENVTAKFNVPTETGKSVTVTGILSSSNASPAEYWDSVTFTSDKNFNLAYVAGSAKYENNVFGKNGGVALSDSIVTNSGTLLGYNALDGKIPGCFQYAGYVTFKVKPQVQKTVAIGITKSVAVHNDIADPTDKMEQTAWQQAIEVKPGDVVDYVIDYRNAGDTNQAGVVIRDMLPENMSYVSGSTKYIIYRANGELYREGDWGGEDTITANGINASEANSGFQPTANAHSYVAMFSAKVDEDIEVACGTTKTLKNVARVSATAEGERYHNEDDADVVIVGEDCPEPSVAVCEVLTANPLAIKTGDAVSFQVSPKYSGDVQVVGSYIDYGDGVKTSVANVFNYNHIYTKEGLFNAKAYIDFIVDGEAENGVSSVECEKPVKVADVPDEWCEVPGKEHLRPDDPNCKSDVVVDDDPTHLPKTGLEVFGVLGLGSMTTAGAYYVASRRSLKK